MTGGIRRLAIVGQPWEHVAPDNGSSMSTIACQLARCLARDWRVTIYGRRWPGQKRWEIDRDNVEFKRLIVFHKHQSVVVALLAILSCYTRTRIAYLLSYFYHPSYALRVALRVRASKYDVVLVHNFLQIASIARRTGAISF